MSAVMDTGNEVTLIKQSTLSELHLKMNMKKVLPNLTGVTRSPLRILGSARVDISTGYQTVVAQWVPVVPDHYMTTDLILGVDVLRKAPLN